MQMFSMGWLQERGSEAKDFGGCEKLPKVQFIDIRKIDCDKLRYMEGNASSFWSVSA